MSVLRVMVVDDEPLAIERLADLLGQIEDTELVGAHQNAADAVKVIPECVPTSSSSMSRCPRSTDSISSKRS